MRICSFLPSATEILYELGLQDYIVGVTHECDYPRDAKNKRIVVRSSFDPAKMDSKEIDDLIARMVREQKDIYIIDDQALLEADPDVIVAQGLCEVCSPYLNEIARAKRILNNKPRIIMLDPHDLNGIFDSIMQVAIALDREEQGRLLINRLKARIEYVKSNARKGVKRKVLCLEWLDPLYDAGHWVPDMVEIANGMNLISKSREPSRRIGWQEVIDSDPDVIVLMACGFDVDRIVKELPKLEANEYWNDLRAVKDKQVYAVDASSYFNRPGPRVVTGVEILAKILHEDIFKDLMVPSRSYKKVY